MIEKMKKKLSNKFQEPRLCLLLISLVSGSTNSSTTNACKLQQLVWLYSTVILFSVVVVWLQSLQCDNLTKVKKKKIFLAVSRMHYLIRKRLTN